MVNTNSKNRMQKAAKVILGNIEGFDSTDSCLIRACYANVSYKLYMHTGRFGNNPTLPVWIAEMLGHEKCDYVESIFYLSAYYSRFTVKTRDITTTETITVDSVIKSMYYKILKLHTEVSQNKLETALNGIILRKKVREWYTQNVKVNNMQ